MKEKLILILSNGLNETGLWQRIILAIKDETGQDLSDSFATNEAEEAFIDALLNELED